MKVLSVRQPWAQLIVDGYKTVENRNWKTPYRGPLAIHAALAPAPFPAMNLVSTMAELGHCPLLDLKSLERGAIVGTVQLVDIIMGHDSVWSDDSTFQWILDDAKALAAPVPTSGRLGLWETNLLD